MSILQKTPQEEIEAKFGKGWKLISDLAGAQCEMYERTETLYAFYGGPYKGKITPTPWIPRTIEELLDDGYTPVLGKNTLRYKVYENEEGKRLYHHITGDDSEGIITDEKPKELK